MLMWPWASVAYTPTREPFAAISCTAAGFSGPTSCEEPILVKVTEATDVLFAACAAVALDVVVVLTAFVVFVTVAVVLAASKG